MPVLLAMDAMQDHPGKLIRVLGDEAHTRKNIEKMLEYENKSGQTTVRPDGCCCSPSDSQRSCAGCTLCIRPYDVCPSRLFTFWIL